jgi:putative ABC transport system permease protein
MSGAPGQAGIASTVAPVIYIPIQSLDATGLIQKGSRVEFNYYFKYAEAVNPDELIKPYEDRLKKQGIDVDTVKNRKQSLGTAFTSMTDFLNLVGFVALLLGCIGVASAVHIYLKDKRSTVAVLRTLGASGQQAFFIYLFQISGMALFGAIVGAALGSFIQMALPIVLADFLPVQNVENAISFGAIGRGIVIGVLVAMLFALLSLVGIRNTSPLRVLRAAYEENESVRDFWLWIVYAVILLFVGSFAFLQLKDIKAAIGFVVVIVAMFLILAGVAQLLMWAVRRFFPMSWSYVWRQSIANLYRPNNQTLILMTCIGLGTALVTTLFFTQDLLLNQVRLSGSENQPNMILFDIQTPQKDGVAKLALSKGLPLMQQVPIVTTRLEAVDGVNVRELMKDTLAKRENWALEREYRCTYRDTMIETETTLEGEWFAKKQKDPNKIYVSLAQRPAEALHVKPGAKLTFDVQGTMVETEVSDIRQVNFNRVQTNFFVVFPTGVLEKAPQFHVIVTRTETPEKSADFQRAVVEQYPNISCIDLSQILKTVDTVLGKVSFVIRFMALFSILTGLVVLISSVALSKYQRMKESVLLRTLGASRRKILTINALEYLMLGMLAVFTGLILSVGGAYLLATFIFKIPFKPDWSPTIWVFLGITSLTVIIGLFNSREVVNLPPLEVLRSEVG